MGLPDDRAQLYANVATAAELREAREIGINSYLGVRSSGVTHEEAIAAWNEGIRDEGGALMQYAAARGAGATHERVLAASRRGVYLGTYSNAVMSGVTDAELFAAQDAGMDLNGYVDARIFGASHDDAGRAFQAGVDLEAYAAGREGGHDHEAAVDFARKHSADFDRQVMLLLSSEELARQQSEGFACDVAFEASDDLGLAETFFGASFDVGLGAWVVGHPDDDDAPEGAVAVTVSARVVAVSFGLAG